jgi:epoxide hydrolase 4
MSDWSWNPSPPSGITVRTVQANGVDFELAEAGSGDRLALMLHGFPELNYSWRFQIPLLVERGWRVWAPNLRGYGATSKPEGVRAYALDHLTQDVAALIDASGAKEVMLVAHDWGAIIAWHFAILKLRPLTKLVIMNVPHPLVGWREIRKWRQFWKSWYIFFFQIPRFPDDVLEVYARSALRPGALTAMINYYRALLRYRSVIDTGTGRVDVPTLMIWGEEDRALNIHCTQGTEQWVSDFTLRRLPGVSHWVQQEAPEEVNRLMADWLD